METEVKIPARDATLDGNLTVPPAARGIVLFVHGSGSSRHSKRNRFVARTLNEAGLATLLFDLLTPEEEAVDMRTAHLRFDIGLLAGRLGSATDWVLQEPAARDLRIGYFARAPAAAPRWSRLPDGLMQLARWFREGADPTSPAARCRM